MARFKHYDYNQTSMVVINYLDQLQPGTFSMPCITSFLKSWICPRFISLISRQVSFPLNDKRLPSYTDWMKHRVDSPHGKQIDSHRMSVVEPVFGNIGTNKRLNRFSLRSKTKVQGQWQLYCLVHNVEKLAKYGHLSQ
nr:transposase [Oceanospirillum maris]